MMIWLGTPNLCIISSMNSTALAADVDETGFTSIHLVNLSMATNMCVWPPCAALSGPTESSPQQANGQDGGIVRRA